MSSLPTSPGRSGSEGSTPTTRSPSRSTTPTATVLGKRMEDHLRIAVCYWHSFNWPGSDVFGGGTFDRPWLRSADDPMAAARQKMDAAFEFFTKLGIPFFCFHDVDIAPEGDTFAESAREPRGHGRLRREEDGGDRGPPAVGHGQPLLPPPLRGRRVDQPRPRGVRLRRRPGETRPRGDPPARRGQLRAVGRPRGLRDAAQHRPRARGRAARPIPPPGGRAQARRSASRGPCSSSPSRPSRPSTSTTTTARPSTASSSGYDLVDEYRVNIEGNHATLAGHSFHHEVAYAVANGDLRLDRRQPGRLPERLGHRPVPQLGRRAVAGPVRDPPGGGFTTGGFNFDTKLRRQSMDRTDLFHGHIGGIDALARALLVAADLIEQETLAAPLAERYARMVGPTSGRRSWPVRRASASLADEGAGGEIDPDPVSGRQEMLENRVNSGRLERRGVAAVEARDRLGTRVEVATGFGPRVTGLSIDEGPELLARLDPGVGLVPRRRRVLPVPRGAIACGRRRRSPRSATPPTTMSARWRPARRDGGRLGAGGPGRAAQGDLGIGDRRR